MKFLFVTKHSTKLNTYLKGVTSLAVLKTHSDTCFTSVMRKKVFVARRGVFRERELISQGASGRNINLDDIQESTIKEPEVGTNPNQEVEEPVEESNILPPPTRRSDSECVSLSFIVSILLRMITIC